MPRKQVYGKRSRAIYDPVAAFDSSGEVTPKHEADTRSTIIEAAKGNVKEKKRSEAEHPRRRSPRKALGEVNSNAVVLPLLVAEEKAKRRPRPTRKILEESEAENEDEAHALRPRSRQDGLDSLTGRERKPKIPDTTRLINDRSLSLDSDVDGTLGGTKTSKAISESQESYQRKDVQKEQRSGSGTPSITIHAPIPPALDEYSQHCRSLLDLSSHTMASFAEWSNQLSSHFSITKIAEASFGEVYRLSLLSQQQIPGFSSNDESVFKVIALKGPECMTAKSKRAREAAMRKAENLSSPDDVANEVKLLQRMSSIPGYTNFRDVRVVQGRPPAQFVQAFKTFNVLQKARKKESSHFLDPEKKASYADDQLWAVIEMQDAGVDLERLVENGGCQSIWFVWDVFWQVSLSLAKGEEGAEFEHRDLHLGNICVRQQSQTEQPALDPKRKLNFQSLETTIIDYTISRALMPDGGVAYHDIAKDAGLFEGDSSEEYQYDIYRYMRGAVLKDDPYADCTKESYNGDRSWQQYHPVTNLIWLHFILCQLLEQLDWPSACKAPLRKQAAIYTEWKRANDLEHILLRVQQLLDPGEICRNEIRSATDLVGLALEEGWIDVEDVVGTPNGDEEESGLMEQFEKLNLNGTVGAEAQEEPDIQLESQQRAKRTRRKQR